MSTISPPPWTFKDHGIYDANGRMLSFLGSIAENGPLMAAAPDLQAALRELVARIDALRDFLDAEELDIEPEITAARAALAKSEGKR